MKRYRKTALLILAVFILGSGALLRSMAQEKPKGPGTFPMAVDGLKPPLKTIDVPFSPSDAVEINKLRVLREDTDRKISEILTTYGGEGEVLLDKHGNYVGIRKTEKKP